MSHPIFVGLYHPFMVNLGMAYYCFTNNMYIQNSPFNQKKMIAQPSNLEYPVFRQAQFILEPKEISSGLQWVLRGLLVSIFLITWGAKDPPWVFQPDRNILKTSEWSPCSTRMIICESHRVSPECLCKTMILAVKDVKGQDVLRK